MFHIFVIPLVSHYKITIILPQIRLSPKIEKSEALPQIEFDANHQEDDLHDFLDELIEAEHDDDWTPTEKVAKTQNEAKETVKSPKKLKREKSRMPNPKKRKKVKFNDAFKTVQIADNGETPLIFELFQSICSW